MSFRFIHTADWQIGKAFAGFPADVAAALREARISAIDRIAEATVRTAAAHVLVAGDVFDAETLAPRTVAQAVARMARHQHLTWHLLPGNHDVHKAGGLWERLIRDGIPQNIRAILTEKPCEIDKNSWIVPSPLKGRATGADPTLHMDTAPTPPGALRIGLAHGSVRGYGSDQTATVSIDPNRAASAGLDYLALGDTHGCVEVAPKTWYSGTPEPDRYPDNEPGFVLAVEIAGVGAPPIVKRHSTAQFDWRKAAVSVSDFGVTATSFAPFRTVAAPHNRPSHDTLLKLTVTGRVSPEQRHGVLGELKRLEASHRHLDADLSGLALAFSAGGLHQLDATSDLKQVAERLLGRAADPAAPDAAVATEALALLLDLAAEARGEAA